MRASGLWLAGLVMLGTLTGLLIGAPTHAQQPGIFEVLIPAQVLGTPAGDGTPLGQVTESITAFAGRNECASADTTSGEDVLLRLGDAGQPAACSAEGAIVTFVNARCHQLATKFVLRSGQRRVLDNLAPLPPGEHPTDCKGNPDTGFGPFFNLVVPAEALQAPVGFNDPVIKTMGQFHGGFTAYADGVACVREDATGRTNALTLRLGHPDQPPACAMEGAQVIVTDDYCRELMQEYTLTLGEDVSLSLVVAPPGTPLSVGCEPRTSAVPSPSPTSTSVVWESIAPPSVGSGGLLTGR